MASTNAVWMAGVGQNAPIATPYHIFEVANPVRQNVGRAHQALLNPIRCSDKLEVGRVIEGPAHWHVDQARRSAEDDRALKLDNIADTSTRRYGIVPHQLAAIIEIVLEKPPPCFQKDPTTVNGTLAVSCRRDA